MATVTAGFSRNHLMPGESLLKSAGLQSRTTRNRVPSSQYYDNTASTYASSKQETYKRHYVQINQLIKNTKKGKSARRKADSFSGQKQFKDTEQVSYIRVP
jgi:hypothetical protein